MFTLFKILFWPVKESLKFCLILFLLFRFTSLSVYVDPQMMTTGLVTVAKNSVNRFRHAVVGCVDYVRSATAVPAGRVAGADQGSK